MIKHIETAGFLLTLLSFLHIAFPRYFGWKEGLRSLSLINRQMMQVHTFFIAFFVFLIGFLCWSSAADLASTALGQKILLGLSVFWIVRLFFQLFIYSKELWRGKRFETTVHIIFIVFWIYLSAVFFVAGSKFFYIE
ncbi:hypothetical protein ACFSQ3_11575 [Sphingobacterium corticis]|uniref:Cytochrome B n=1 Tax=Sphingobacterium corticis TaxID=1812823 RepID=A0ABW5NNG3_9SPHI